MNVAECMQAECTNIFSMSTLQFTQKKTCMPMANSNAENNSYTDILLVWLGRIQKLGEGGNSIYIDCPW